jgi:hypothetical protein
MPTVMVTLGWHQTRQEAGASRAKNGLSAILELATPSERTLFCLLAHPFFFGVLGRAQEAIHSISVAQLINNLFAAKLRPGESVKMT